MKIEGMKKKKWCKFVCYLIIFVFLFEIPMPLYASDFEVTAVSQNDEAVDEANTNDSSTSSTEAVDSDDSTSSTETEYSDDSTSSTETEDSNDSISSLPDIFNIDVNNDSQIIDGLLGTETQEEESDDAQTALVANNEREIVTELPDLREANVKYFLNTDGTQTAAVYDHDVHYLASDGTYQDIDNSLYDTETSGGKDILVNEDNDTEIILAQKSSEGNLVSIHKDGYNVKWQLLSADSSEAKDTSTATKKIWESIRQTLIRQA